MTEERQNVDCFRKRQETFDKRETIKTEKIKEI